MSWIKARGRIEINNGVRIVTGFDFCRYYQWHIKRAFYNTVKVQSPKHGSHITLVSPKIHGITDYSKVECFKGKIVEFFYNPEELYQSKINFWIPVKADVEKAIKFLLRVRDGRGYLGLHLTVANRKNL